MAEPIKILLQTTIPPTEDDWHIGRFGLLRDYLAGLKGANGAPLTVVEARDRAPPGRPDPVLSRLDESDYDELWLFAVDTGDGLTQEDCAGISRFRKRGGGMMVTRDHHDLGSSVCNLGGVGSAHYFHSTNPDPDPSHHANDDQDNPDIQWPNYHSGANGDYQEIQVAGAPHSPHSPLKFSMRFSMAAATSERNPAAAKSSRATKKYCVKLSPSGSNAITRPR